MATATQTVVIVGAGHAGVAVAAYLRKEGWRGCIELIGDEDRLPYQRPPLSKGWLKGELKGNDLLLRPAKFYEEQRIHTRLGVPVERVDRTARTVTLKDRSTLGFDYLIIATGARPRKLSILGASLDGVLELRSAADASHLRTALTPGRRLAIIGGGYVGLEVAATSISLGVVPIVIERESRVLARVASDEISDFLLRQHRLHGVTLHLNATVDAFHGVDGRITAVRLSDGNVVACDIALVGVGAIPNDDMAGQAGLVSDGGIVVDSNGRTSDPAIYAIGDCTLHPMPHSTTLGRFESVPNAVEQAKQAAAVICGNVLLKNEIPWFWSDQFDLRLQMAGVLAGASETIVRSNTATTISIFHLTSDCRVQAVETINSAAEFMAGKALIARGQPVLPARLRNQAIALRDIAA